MKIITKTVEIEIYAYDELSEEAQEKAYQDWDESKEWEIWDDGSDDMVGTRTHFEDESVSGSMEFLKDGTFFEN